VLISSTAFSVNHILIEDKYNYDATKLIELPESYRIESIQIKNGYDTFTKSSHRIDAFELNSNTQNQDLINHTNTINLNSHNYDAILILRYSLNNTHSYDVSGASLQIYLSLDRPGSGGRIRNFLDKHGIGDTVAARRSSKKAFENYKKKYHKSKPKMEAQYDRAFARNKIYGEHSHFIPKGSKLMTYTPNFIKHSRFNLKYMSGLQHAKIDPVRHGFLKKKYRHLSRYSMHSLPKRVWVGMPTPTKMALGLVSGGIAAYYLGDE
jgi:hypothetical protein